MTRSWPGRGKRVQLPDGYYEADRRVEQRGAFWAVRFEGEDGRERFFTTQRWPLASVHEALADAFAVRTGPGGGLNTEHSANGTWAAAGRFVVGVAECSPEINGISDIDASVARRWLDQQIGRGRTSRQIETDGLKIASLLRNVRGGGPAVAAAAEVLFRGPIPDAWHDSEPEPERLGNGVGGYDDETFEWLKAAARADLARRRDQIQRSWRLVETLRDGGSLSNVERAEAQVLSDIAESGDVAGVLRMYGVRTLRERLPWAKKLYLVEADLAPLLVLFVALSGHNVESIKELPAAHRLIGKDRVSLNVTKRRHGFSNWEEPASFTVKTGDFSSAGGLYLLIERLCRPSRTIAGSDKLIAVWSSGTSDFKRQALGHHYPWHRSLRAATISFGKWCRGHDPAGLPRFDLTMNRLRTTKLRLDRTTPAGDSQDPPVGVSLEVFYRSYFAPDERTRDWAAGLIAMTLAELEDTFRGVARQRTLLSRSKPAAVEETAFAGCMAALQNPFTGEACFASFLTCFICPNVVITDQHLPGILRLKEELIERWDRVARHVWWRRYGAAWIAITHDILPAKTPQALTAAARRMPEETPLRLLEGLAGGSW